MMNTGVYNGRVISVRAEQRTLPNGVKTQIDIVRHPGAVLILPFLSREKIILLHQYRPAIGQYLFELPAGTLKAKEDPLACAKRELIEETGFKAAKIVKIGKIFPVPGYSTELITLFKAEGLTSAVGNQDEDELIEILPVSVSVVRKMVRQGKIIDAKTICALSLSGVLS